MDMKERMDALMASVPEDKRGELAIKLLEAETIEQRIDIAKEYLGEQASADAPEWLSQSYELSLEELDQVGGGVDEMPWDNEIDEYGCY